MNRQCCQFNEIWADCGLLHDLITLLLFCLRRVRCVSRCTHLAVHRLSAWLQRAYCSRLDTLWTLRCPRSKYVLHDILKPPHAHTHTFCWFTLFPPFVSSYWPCDLDSWYIMKRGVVDASVSSKSFSRITKLASCIPSVLVADQWFGARNIAASAISTDHKGFSGETIADQCWHVLLSLDKLARQTKAKRETVLFCWFSPVQTKLAK